MDTLENPLIFVTYIFNPGSLGVILYAMLSGYLPFDDDPLNPEGTNINQLYTYICATQLTFADHVTNDARDVLKLILVVDPKLRAEFDVIWTCKFMSAWVSTRGTYTCEKNSRPVAEPLMTQSTKKDLPQLYSVSSSDNEDEDTEVLEAKNLQPAYPPVNKPEKHQLEIPAFRPRQPAPQKPPRNNSEAQEEVPTPITDLEKNAVVEKTSFDSLVAEASHSEVNSTLDKSTGKQTTIVMGILKNTRSQSKLTNFVSSSSKTLDASENQNEPDFVTSHTSILSLETEGGIKIKPNVKFLMEIPLIEKDNEDLVSATGTLDLQYVMRDRGKRY